MAKKPLNMHQKIEKLLNKGMFLKHYNGIKYSCKEKKKKKNYKPKKPNNNIYKNAKRHET